MPNSVDLYAVIKNTHTYIVLNEYRRNGAFFYSFLYFTQKENSIREKFLLHLRTTDSKTLLVRKAR